MISVIIEVCLKYGVSTKEGLINYLYLEGGRKLVFEVSEGKDNVLIGEMKI